MVNGNWKRLAVCATSHGRADRGRYVLENRCPTSFFKSRKFPGWHGACSITSHGQIQRPARERLALKEARESRFWLRVIAASEPRFALQTRPHVQESNELVAMLTASIKTAKSNLNRREPQIDESDDA
jgi:hypothetical protein